MQPAEVAQFCQYLRVRNYSPHTVGNYAIDLRLFFARSRKRPQQVTWRDVDRFIAGQHEEGLSAATINRRLNALKHFFDFLAGESNTAPINPVKPSHHLRVGNRCQSRRARRRWIATRRPPASVPVVTVCATRSRRTCWRKEPR